MARSVSTTLLYVAAALVAMSQAPAAMAQDPNIPALDENGQPQGGGGGDPNQAALDEERRRLDQEIANRQAEEERVRREAEQQQQQQQKSPEQINAERENADRLLREAQDRQRIEEEAQRRAKDQEAEQQQQQQQQQQEQQQQQQQQQQPNPQEDERRQQEEQARQDEMLAQQQREASEQRQEEEQRRQEEEKRQAEEKLIQQRMQELEQQKQQQTQQQQNDQEQQRINQEEQQRINQEAQRSAAEQQVKAKSAEEVQRMKDEQNRLLEEHERMQAAADERRLKQLKNEADAKTRDIIGDADVENGKLQEGDILITGRTGVNGIVNGHFKLLPNKQFHGRPSYAKMRKVQTGPEAIDLAVWWSSGKWYVGLLNEIGSDAAYAFIPSQAALPDQANGVWSIWDGKSWVQDDRVRAVGTGPRKLHVGNGDEYGPGDDDYNEEEYMAMYEEKRRAAEKEKAKPKPENGDGPVPVLPHHAPKKIHFRASCPEGHPGCSAANLCKSCPSECGTCQNFRETDKYGQCSASDCFTCEHGYKHIPKHTDGRGYCESAGSQMMVYVIGGIAAVLLVGAAIFVFCCNDKRALGGRGARLSSGRNQSNLPY